MTGIGFLIRETAERGIRVHAEPITTPAPAGAHLLRTTTCRAHGVADDEGRLVNRDVELEMLLPGLGASTPPSGRPVMWWALERKVGEHTEQVWKGSKKNGHFEDIVVEDWTPDWEEAAGTMLDAIREMAWVFELAVIGEAFTPRSEWLCCNVCDESQMISKSKGAATAKQKCHMTFKCEGFVRRLPGILFVNPPKLLVAPKPKVEKNPSEPADKPTSTPGAERFKKKTTTHTVTVEEWIADADVSYEESAADAEAA